MSNRIRGSCLLLFLAGGAFAGELKSYDSKYYSVKSDMDPQFVRETIMRMTATCKTQLKSRRVAPQPRSAAQPAPPINPSLPGLLVVSARYGVSKRWANVTDQVRMMVKDDAIEFPQDLTVTLGVDPWPKALKYIDMIVMLEGVPVRLYLAENKQSPPMRIASPRKSAAKKGP